MLYSGTKAGSELFTPDLKVEAKLRQGIDENHEVEKWYSDLSTLLNYLGDKRGDGLTTNEKAKALAEWAFAVIFAVAGLAGFYQPVLEFLLLCFFHCQ